MLEVMRLFIWHFLFIYFRLSKLWSMLHRGLMWVGSEKNKINLTIILTLNILLFFIITFAFLRLYLFFLAFLRLIFYEKDRLLWLLGCVCFDQLLLSVFRKRTKINKNIRIKKCCFRLILNNTQDKFNDLFFFLERKNDL